MICKHCNKPIIMHVEGRYTIEDSDDMEWCLHYKCHEERLKGLRERGDALAKKLPEVETTLANLKKLFVLGWLLVGTHGVPIAWYPSEQICQKAKPYYSNYNGGCVPDRFEFEEGGSLYTKGPQL